MDSLHISNMVVHGGKRKELARKLLIVQETLDTLARFAGSDQILPAYLKAETEALVSSVSHAAMDALDLHVNLTNKDVFGPLACGELGLFEDALYNPNAAGSR